MAAHAGALTMPQARSGLMDWVMTVDHKKIGILYIISAFTFFVIGGIEALLMRTQLGTPMNTFLPPDLYNQIFTMHGTTMIFLAVMPLSVGFGNYIVPIMLGARDMAFPRLNAFSYWLFLFGGLFMYTSFVAGGAPSAGWFSYAPLTETQFSPTHGMDFWVLGLNMLGIASLAGSINFIVTILNLRAPGMSINRLPLFVWMTLITSFLLIFAFPSVTVAIVLLFFDRQLGANFYVAKMGGDPLLWQHLFWFFGHPEVYIMILPAMGIVSEVLPTFSRKPIFGYSFIAYSGVAIGFLGFVVWAHHMFAVGLPPNVNLAFSLSSMLIGVPTGVKIFNWIGTIWGGNISFKTAMLFAVGFIATFILGGISGIFLAAPPVDYQLTDTYFVVAHLHYVLFAGSMMGMFAGTYYWFPKMTGKLLSEAMGQVHFWLVMVGMTLAFFPMHWLGMAGMPRRIYTYHGDMGWDLWNLVSTVGAFIIALGVLVFLVNIWVSLRSGERATDDPWDGASLEWKTSSPPPVYNFAVIPTVRSRRPFWDEKYGSGRAPVVTAALVANAAAATGARVPAAASEHSIGGHDLVGTALLATGVRGPSGAIPQGLRAEVAATGVRGPAVVEEHFHMPSPSIYPAILALGLLVMSFGLLYMKDLPTIDPLPINPVLILVGVAILLYSVLRWQGEISAGK